MSRRSSARSSRRETVTLHHPIFMRWPAQCPDRLQLFSSPTPNEVKVGIMLEETSLAYEPHRIDITADESHDPAFLALNPNGKIPAIYDPDGPSGMPLAASVFIGRPRLSGKPNVMPARSVSVSVSGSFSSAGS